MRFKIWGGLNIYVALYFRGCKNLPLVKFRGGTLKNAKIGKKSHYLANFRLKLANYEFFVELIYILKFLSVYIFFPVSVVLPFGFLRFLMNLGVLNPHLRFVTKISANENRTFEQIFRVPFSPKRSPFVGAL